MQKLVNIDYVYTLQTTNTWQQFPDMYFRFNLKYSQFVNVAYKILLWTPGNDYFCTRVLIDGKEERIMRDITGNYYNHSNKAS